jgi:GAF domain-containing protein
VAISLGELAQSIGTLAELDPAADADRALGRAVDAARILLDTETAGLLLADADGDLEFAVTVDARAERAAEAQQRKAVGPCVVAFEEARPVAVVDVTADSRWQPLQQELAAAGIRSCLSVPVNVAGGPAGVLDLYSTKPRVWDDSQIAAAQSYAGVLSLLLAATLTAAAAGQLAEQLQHALTARVRIEQAKGVLMASHNLSERDAWERLRRTARASRRPVSAVAAELLADLSQEREADVPAATGEQAQRR